MDLFTNLHNSIPSLYKYILDNFTYKKIILCIIFSIVLFLSSFGMGKACKSGNSFLGSWASY